MTYPILHRLHNPDTVSTCAHPIILLTQIYLPTSSLYPFLHLIHLLFLPICSQFSYLIIHVDVDLFIIIFYMHFEHNPKFIVYKHPSYIFMHCELDSLYDGRQRRHMFKLS